MLFGDSISVAFAVAVTVHHALSPHQGSSIPEARDRYSFMNERTNERTNKQPPQQFVSAPASLHSSNHDPPLSVLPRIAYRNTPTLCARTSSGSQIGVSDRNSGHMQGPNPLDFARSFVRRFGQCRRSLSGYSCPCEANTACSMWAGWLWVRTSRP